MADALPSPDPGLSGHLSVDGGPAELSSSDMTNGRSSFLGYRVTEFGDGRSRAEWQPGPAVANPMGVVHGGFVGVIIDDVAGFALVSVVDGVQAFPTATMHVDFIRGIPIGGRYVCRGTVVRTGRKVSVVDATVSDEEGRLLARGTCTFAADLDGTDAVGRSGLAPIPFD